MMKFSEKWDKLENLEGKIILKHALFGQQVYVCDAMKTINTKDKLGLILKGQEIYVDKHNIQHTEFYDDRTYIVADQLLRIEVNCK